MLLFLASNHSFPINLENFFSKIPSILCGGPQGSILGPLLLLIYVIDMPIAGKSNLFLCVDDMPSFPK